MTATQLRFVLVATLLLLALAAAGAVLLIKALQRREVAAEGFDQQEADRQRSSTIAKRWLQGYGIVAWILILGLILVGLKIFAGGGAAL
jgi:hypothetical protein